MEFSNFIRIPFPIKATQITEENMEDVCMFIGTEIMEENGQRYIRLDRKIVPRGSKAGVGWWVTKMGNQLRCYPNGIFIKQFTPRTEEWASWVDEDEPTSESETKAILEDPEAMAAINEAEAETPSIVHTTIEIPDTLQPKPQIGDTYVEDVVEPYAGS